MKHLFLAFLAGLAAACGFQPLGLWPLTLAALAGLIWLVEEAPSLRSALARGWWFGVGHFALGLNWIATAFTFQAKMPASLGWAAVVLLSLYLAVYPAMAAGLAWRHGRFHRLRFVLLFAAAWLVSEWLRATLFTGFAWNPLGVALLPTPVARLAPLVGTYGLSAATMLLAGVLFLLAHRQWRTAGALAGGLAVVFGGALAAGGPTPPPSGISVRIVQPNIGQEEKWRSGFEDRNFARLKQLSGIPDGRPRLLLWPEVAVPDDLDRDPAARERIARLIRPGDLVLTGAVGLISNDGVHVSAATNSLYALDAGGRILGRYDKAHLVPYGEYLPMRPILSAVGLSRLAPGDSDFQAGPGPRSLVLPGFGRVGVQICYEMTFSGDVAEDGNRPRFIFNPSNDAWFGAWGPPQHLAQARLRALEEGLPVLRATPTGVSAVIDAEGRLLHSLGWRTAGAIDAELPGAKPATPFARWGNSLPFILALLLAALAIAVGRKAG